MQKGGTETVVAKPPTCDHHPNGTARYDFKTVYGMWVYGCEECYQRHGYGRLGVGLGQRLVLRGEP